MSKKRKKKKRNKSNKKHTQSPMDQISTAIDAAEWENAEKLLKKEIEKKNTAGCHYYLGHVYRCTSTFSNNRLDEALLQQEIALKLCEDKSKIGWIYYEIGKIYKDYHYDEQDNKKALEYFQKATACENTACDAYEQIGYLYTWEEVDKKIEIYKKGIEKFPNNKSCYLLCTKCLTYHKEDYHAAEYILISAIENKIESSAVYYNLGEIKIEQEMLDEAISYYKKIFDYEDANNLHAGISFVIALIYLKKESYNEAEKFLSQALNQRTDNKINNSIYFGLILCSKIAKKTEGMIDFFRKIDFCTNEQENFNFCGRKNFELGEESYPLDYGMVDIDYSNIIMKTIDSLEEIQDQFNKDLNHKFFLLKALLLEKNRNYEECILYLESALNESESGLLWDIYKSVFEHMVYDEKDNYKKGKALTQYYNLIKKSIQKFPVLGPVLSDTILTELVSALFETKKYKKIIEVCELYNHRDINSNLFKIAYSYNEAGNHTTAQLLYERDLEKSPESTAVLNNLANLYDNAGKIEEAIALYEKALAVDPDDKQVVNNLQIALNKKDELKQQKIQAQKEQEKQARIQQVATTHWPSLDYYKKKVLIVLNTIDGFDSFDELADLCKMDVRWIKSHYKKLIEFGMVIEDEERFEINPEIKPLIERENSHSVAINVIKSNKNINFKPIFNSKLEYNIYRLMIGLFPNHLVFPNMSLQTIFTYDRMKDVLDSEVFKFYLLTSVDICIISTANYLPILCYEVDSPYHDVPDQIARDKKKDEIFEAGGTPLIRLRPHGKPSDMEIREKIIKSIQEFGKSLDPLEKQNDMVLQLLKNID
jgi:tetratricopeptide (TPR) repeat protein